MVRRGKLSSEGAESAELGAATMHGPCHTTHYTTNGFG